MDAFDAARTALAVRSYRERPIPERAHRPHRRRARFTGSSRNGQPRCFVVVTDRDTLRRLGEVVTTGRYVAQAPLAIPVAVERGSRFVRRHRGRAFRLPGRAANGEPKDRRPIAEVASRDRFGRPFP